MTSERTCICGEPNPDQILILRFGRAIYCGDYACKIKMYDINQNTYRLLRRIDRLKARGKMERAPAIARSIAKIAEQQVEKPDSFKVSNMEFKDTEWITAQARAVNWVSKYPKESQKEILKEWKGSGSSRYKQYYQWCKHLINN